MTCVRLRDVVLSGSVILAGLVGCKKQIDITSVDAGAAPVTAEPTTNAAANPPANADPPKDDTASAGGAGEPLAPLTGGEGPKKPVSSGGSSTVKPKPTATASGGKPTPTGTGTGTGSQPPPAGAQPPECAAAARFCNHPAYATDSAIRNMCDTKKAECTRKGGHL